MPNLSTETDNVTSGINYEAVLAIGIHAKSDEPRLNNDREANPVSDFGHIASKNCKMEKLMKVSHYH
jgi:hypothetical protein